MGIDGGTPGVLYTKGYIMNEQRYRENERYEPSWSPAARDRLRGGGAPSRPFLPQQDQPPLPPLPRAKATGAAALQIKIPLPRLNLLKSRPKLGKKPLTIGGAFVAAAVIGIGIYGVFGHKAQVHNPAVATTTQVLSKTVGSSKPSYSTLLPAGKTIEQLGGWGRVSPPDKDPVFAFADTIKQVPITVSQQPLPENFKKDPSAEEAKLATQFSATDKATTTDGQQVYIGTGNKGVQSAITIKDGLLILIRANSQVSNDQWAAYVSSLH